jgi:excisionase family DNA binding protein
MVCVVTQHSSDHDSYLTVDDLAEMLRVSRLTIYGWHKAGTGPRAVRVGKYLRFHRRHVEEWLAGRADPVAS